jgi:hypothetical protein
VLIRKQTLGNTEGTNDNGLSIRASNTAQKSTNQSTMGHECLKNIIHIIKPVNKVIQILKNVKFEQFWVTY